MLVFGLFTLCLASSWANIIRPELRSVSHHGRISGGQKAGDNQFPWQVAIYKTDNQGYEHFCNGALISRYWVLTSAFCVYNGAFFTVVLGSISLYGFDPKRVSIQTALSFIHPQFDLNGFQHNIGLIKIDANYAGNDHIKVITLSAAGIDSNVFVTLSGWGTAENDDGIVNDLRFVNLRTIPNVQCANIYGNLIVDEFLCTIGTSNEGGCSGDIGAPLVTIDANGLPVHVGVLNFVNSDGCDSGYPTGYIRTSVYSKWIADTILLNS